MHYTQAEPPAEHSRAPRKTRAIDRRRVTPPIALVLIVFLAGCHHGLLLPRAPLRPADAIVVLGNRPPVDADGQVREETATRVRQGVALYERGLAPLLVMTGGADRSGNVEALVMRDLAISLGAAPEHVLIEPTARDTVDNAERSVRLLCEEQSPPCMPRVIIVSAPTHLRRARQLFRCAGAIPQVSAAGPPRSASSRRRSVALEAGAQVAYGFRDPCRAMERRARMRTRAPIPLQN